MSETDTALLELRDLGIRQLPDAGDASDRRLFQAMEREMAREYRRFVLTGRGSATDHRSGSRFATPRIKRSRRFALAGSIAVAGLAVAGVLGFQDSGFTPPPALAATMDRLGHIAVTRDWGGIPGPGQYLYTESESVQITNGVASTVDHRQIWVPSVGHVLLSDPQANLNDNVDQIDGPIGAFPTTIEGWKSLSSDPSTLLQQIHELDAPRAADHARRAVRGCRRRPARNDDPSSDSRDSLPSRGADPRRRADRSTDQPDRPDRTGCWLLRSTGPCSTN